MASVLTARRTLVVSTLLVTWLVWGSSFVAITYALESFPPLLLMATRFIVAGLVATGIGLALARRAGRSLPSPRAWRDAAIVGFGFIAIGMGATGWAATRLPTGTAALLVATAPLWIVLLQLALTRGASRNAIALTGVAVGVAGVCVLVAPGGGGSGGLDVGAALVLVAANAAWAAASLFAPRAEKAGGLLLGVGMQMLSGGVQLALFALATGEAARFDVGAISSLAFGGWTYLVLASSIGGFLAYGWLLDNVSAGTASTHAFVNPLVAVGLGVAMLGEHVDGRMFVAGAAVIVAVVLLLAAELRTTVAATPEVDVLPGLDVAPQPTPIPARRTRAARAVSIGRPVFVGRSSVRRGFAPAPTPAFASRRAARPWQATDGMDALAIDEALDRIG
jgi:drug/metabolite transporter (DMT)-like permease